MSASQDALDPELARFVSSVCAESARLAQGRELDWPQRRAIAESVRLPWRTGGPTMHSTIEHQLPSQAGPIRLRIYRPGGVADAAPALVYLHGGGWCLFSIDTHDRLMREYAAAAGIVVVGVDYSLAPEHPFPTALNQCVHALTWLREHASEVGVNALRVALGGDSAGGNLALCTALALRDEGVLEGVTALLLNYGGFDPSISKQAMACLGTKDDMLSAVEMDEFWRSYLGAGDPHRHNPLAVPTNARLHDLPPTLLLYGDRDMLGEQSVAMTERLRAAGVFTELREYRGAPHSFLEAMSISSLARDAIDTGAAWLRRHLHDEILGGHAA